MQEIIDSLRRLNIGGIQRYKNLAVAPLIGDDSSLEYLTLSQALGQGFKITETRGGGNVPQVYVQNKTGRNVLAIAGECLVGGKQNRTLNRNVYFAEDFEGVIDVYCIQRGRWGPSPIQTPQPTPTEAPCPEPVPVQGEPVPVGYFSSEGKVVSRHLASPKLSKSQEQTWDGVHHLMCESGAHSRTGDYTEIMKQKRQELEEFRKHFSLLERQVGIVAASSSNGDRLYVADVFDKSSVFKNYFSGLLESYIIDSGLGSERVVELSEQEAKGFVDSVDSCEPNPVKAVSLGREIEMRGENLLGFALVFNDVPVYVNLITPKGKLKEKPRERAEDIAETLRRTNQPETRIRREVF